VVKRYYALACKTIVNSLSKIETSLDIKVVDSSACKILPFVKYWDLKATNKESDLLNKVINHFIENADSLYEEDISKCEMEEELTPEMLDIIEKVITRKITVESLGVKTEDVVGIDSIEEIDSDYRNLFENNEDLTKFDDIYKKYLGLDDEFKADVEHRVIKAYNTLKPKSKENKEIEKIVQNIQSKFFEKKR
jgi:hypothetical protein